MFFFRRKTNRLNKPDTTKNNATTQSSERPYILPYHLQETNRLDFQHYMLRNAFGGLYQSPINRPVNILDVGCGTGRWMREMALTFPSAIITGVDLLLPTHEGNNKLFPSNCRFVRCDVLDGLPFDNQSFDFVHQSLLEFAYTLQAWPRVIQELVRITQRGGWIELLEYDLKPHPIASQGQRTWDWLATVIDQRGLDQSIARKLATFLRRAQLANVTDKRVTLPVGNWGGRPGTVMAQNVRAFLHSAKPLLAAYNGVSPQEVDQTIDLWLIECDKLHTSCGAIVAYGRRE